MSEGMEDVDQYMNYAWLMFFVLGLAVVLYCVLSACRERREQLTADCDKFRGKLARLNQDFRKTRRKVRQSYDAINKEIERIEKLLDEYEQSSGT